MSNARAHSNARGKQCQSARLSRTSEKAPARHLAAHDAGHDGPAVQPHADAQLRAIRRGVAARRGDHVHRHVRHRQRLRCRLNRRGRAGHTKVPVADGLHLHDAVLVHQLVKIGEEVVELRGGTARARQRGAAEPAALARFSGEPGSQAAAAAARACSSTRRRRRRTISIVCTGVSTATRSVYDTMSPDSSAAARQHGAAACARNRARVGKRRTEEDDDVVEGLGKAA